MISNKTTTFILGWVFLIASFIHNYNVNIIVASIFFSAHYTIEEISKKQ
jgi:hypothetical protein